MNVYKFFKVKDKYQIIVAKSLAEASRHCSIEYTNVRVLHENVTVVD